MFGGKSIVDFATIVGDTQPMGNSTTYLQDGRVHVWRTGTTVCVDVGRLRHERVFRTMQAALTFCYAFAGNLRASGTASLPALTLDVIVNEPGWRMFELPSKARFLWLRKALATALMTVVALHRFGAAMFLVGDRVRWHQMDAASQRFSLLEFD